MISFKLCRDCLEEKANSHMIRISFLDLVSIQWIFYGSLREPLSYLLKISLYSKRKMVYGETVIKPDSITAQSSHYVRKGVVCNVEVSRNSDNIDESFDVTALILIDFSFDSIKYFPSIIILLCP
jgi:hypothetical protein